MFHLLTLHALPTNTKYTTDSMCMCVCVCVVLIFQSQLRLPLLLSAPMKFLVNEAFLAPVSHFLFSSFIFHILYKHLFKILLSKRQICHQIKSAQSFKLDVFFVGLLLLSLWLVECNNLLMRLKMKADWVNSYSLPLSLVFRIVQERRDKGQRCVTCAER